MARIRGLCAEDVPAAAQILVTNGTGGTLGETEAEVRTALSHLLGRAEVFVAAVDDTVAGIACFLADGVFAHGGLLRFLVVRQEMRRKGIGRQLLGFVERKVFQRSQNLYVLVPESDEPMLMFLQAVGYIKVGEMSDPAVVDGPQLILRKAAEGGGTRRRVRATQP